MLMVVVVIFMIAGFLSIDSRCIFGLVMLIVIMVVVVIILILLVFVIVVVVVMIFLILMLIIIITRKLPRSRQCALLPRRLYPLLNTFVVRNLVVQIPQVTINIEWVSEPLIIRLAPHMRRSWIWYAYRAW